MNLSAINNLDGSSLTVRVVSDESHQKVVQVRSRTLLRAGANFDITLSFLWQATESEPNDFDGINLMSFRHPVGMLTYKAILHWQPAQAKVLAYGVKNFAPDLHDELFQESPANPGWWEYSFAIPDPGPMAYLISFGPN